MALRREPDGKPRRRRCLDKLTGDEVALKVADFTNRDDHQTLGCDMMGLFQVLPVRGRTQAQTAILQLRRRELLTLRDGSAAIVTECASLSALPHVPCPRNACLPHVVPRTRHL